MSDLIVSIQHVGKGDLKALQKIGKATFFETFLEDCTPSDMEKYLEEQHSLAQLNNELDNSESQFFFAKLEGEVVGYLKINWGKAQTESKLKNALEIERIYILSEFQGYRIGKLLMDKALEIAKSNQFNFVWLGVWENNFKAIRFYEKIGFTVFDSHIFRVGDDPQTDVLMKLQL